MDIRAERSWNPHAQESLFGAAFGVSNRKSGDVSIVDVNGALVGEQAVQAFRNRIRELLQSGARKFAINLSEVSIVDSDGWGGLAAAYNWIVAARGQIDFFGVAPRVKRTLDRLRLNSVFAIFDDETNAVQAFTRGVQSQPGVQQAG